MFRLARRRRAFNSELRSVGRPERNLDVDTYDFGVVGQPFLRLQWLGEQHLDGAKFCGGSVLYCPRGNKFFSGRNSHLRANFPHFNRRVRLAVACEMRNKGAKINCKTLRMRRRRTTNRSHAYMRSLSLSLPLLPLLPYLYGTEGERVRHSK